MTDRHRCDTMGAIHELQVQAEALRMATGTVLTSGPVAAPEASAILTEPLLNVDILYEVVDGEIRELPTSARETQFASDLAVMVGNHASNSSLGRVQAEMLFRIDASRNLQRRPDVSYVSFERWPRGKPVPGTEAWEVVPNLAVEIVSPTNGANEVVGKVEDYFACGVQRVWVFYPLFSKVYDYGSATEVRILTRSDRLSGGDVLPGFEIALSEVFEDPTVVDQSVPTDR
jgi:Uma2 family endonuclease